MNKFKDGTVEYYEKIRSYIKPKSLILDYGSGRGSWFYNDNDKKRRNDQLIAPDSCCDS